MSEPIIEMIGVNKWYGDFQALKNINFTVHERDRIVVCGPSGSGKSTMIGQVLAILNDVSHN